MRRAISIAYGASAGAALVKLGVPVLAVIAAGSLIGLGLELYRGFRKGGES